MDVPTGRPSEPAGGLSSGERQTSPDVQRAGSVEGVRFPFLDQIKVAFIMLIIVVHGLLGYASVKDVWTYQGRREATLSETANTVVMSAVLVGLLFAMATFFFMAGLLAPNSLDHRGPRAYAADRLLRLGVPFALWVLVLWPLTVWGMDMITGYSDRSLWESFTQAQPFPDTGPMWFIEVLLIYSLVYAVAVAWRRRSSPGRNPVRPPETVTSALLIALALGVALTTFGVRLVFSLSSNQFAHLNAWQWPAYIALFWLGIAASRRGWLTSVPGNLIRTAGFLAGAGLILALGIVTLLGAEVVGVEQLAGGWSLPAVAIALAEGMLSVGVSVWLIGVAQRNWNAPPNGLQRAMARSAYGAFALQGIVLIALALLARPLPMSPEGKGVLVGVAGVAVSFGLAWLLAKKTPLGRVL